MSASGAWREREAEQPDGGALPHCRVCERRNERLLSPIARIQGRDLSLSERERATTVDAAAFPRGVVYPCAFPGMGGPGRNTETGPPILPQ